MIDRGFQLDRLGATPLSMEDSAELQALAEQCGAYFKKARGRRLTPRTGMELLADALGDSDRVLLGLRLRGRSALVGILDLQLRHPGPDELTVVLLLLAPAERRRGLGREVVEGLLSAVASDVRAVCLGVEDTSGAGAFWEEVGFAPDGAEPGVTNYRRQT